MDRLIFALLIFGIPATVLATILRWLDIEYAVAIVWAVVLLTVTEGLLRMRRGADAA